ncbi:hypothetical protein DB347_01915 [Opitutaceae bacterium EW11]|nr:hypothetical protein DB347_01915 [Opitutaceae bacterium EW11]
MKKPLRVLIVEDSEDDAKLLIRELSRGGYDVTAKRVETGDDLRAALGAGGWDVILSDYSLPHFSGEAALRTAQESGQDLPFIFVSGTMGEDIAVGAMKAGAHDYVMKNNLARLVPAIERELRDAIERQQHREAETQMRMSEHKYRHLFRFMSDAALLISADSDRIIDANEQAEILFRRTREQLLGATSAELYPRNPHLQLPDRAGEAGSHVSGESEALVPRAGGAPVPVHVCVSRVELYDRPFTLALFRDISERKRTEAALRNVLRHARTIVADAVVTAPEDWRPDKGKPPASLGWEWHFADAEAAQQVLPLEVPPGREYREFWDAAEHPDDRKASFAKISQCLVSGARSWQQEFRALDRGGRVHYFVQAATLEPLGPRSWQAMTINTDITDRVLVEEALRTSEERLATIFNLSPTGICIVRASDDHFVEANRAFLSGTGFVREEVIGRTPADLKLWSEITDRAEILRECREKGAAVAFRLMGRKKNGEIGVGLSSVAKIVLNGQDHYLWMIQDITELDRAEDARRESERRFRQVAENIDEVFWLTDASTGQKFYVSPAYARIWGRSCEAVYADPLSWLEAVCKEDRERVRDALSAQVGGTYDVEYRIVRPDGSVRCIHERAFPVKDSEGKTYRIAGVASDITQRRELEEQFRQAQKMEAVGQLAGGIAHDFNNLLTVIQLQSSLLVQRLKEDRESEQGMQQIMDAAKRASNLTRQLLTFSRRQTQTARTVDLGEVIGSMTKMLRRILGEDIMLESRFAPGLPPVYADPGMMEQVLMNLVVNARDAMPSGGRLTISIDSMMLDAEYVLAHPPAKEGRYVCLEVTDTGCGIPPEIRTRIFEPFFTTKEVGKGTGLGLATVFGIVNQHRGWLELDSEVGKGTTFRIFLPALSQAAAEAAMGEETPAIRGGTESILLVEDESLVRALASAALRERGYRVYEADNAVHALEKWGSIQDKVDLLLTDLIMPGGVSGKDLADELMRRSPSLRIIYTTGHSTSAVGQQLDLKSGINYLEKPYSFSDLAVIVRRRLDEAPHPVAR